MRERYKTLLIILSFVLVDCALEDVITYELESADPQIVIEGSITDEVGPYTVKITRTTNYFEPTEIEKVRNAEVILSDSRGNSENLIEKSPGVYQTINFESNYNTEYYLQVRIDDQEYKANTSLVEPIILDSISYVIDQSGKYYVMAPYFQDNPNKKDFTITNFRLNNGEFDKPLVYDDRLSNGNYIEGKPFAYDIDSLKIGANTVECIMRTVDKNTYNFFNTLQYVLVSEGDPFASPTLENPKTNLSNGALGYFGGYSISRKEIEIIKE